MSPLDKQLNDFFGSTPDQKETEKRENLRETLDKKPPIRSRIRLIPKVLSVRERYTILALLVIAASALLAMPIATYWHFTLPAPDYGGTITEGIAGKQPRYINPLLSQADNDADRDLVALVYSGLMKYNGDGKIVPDIAKSYEISPDGLSYTVYLKDNARWHDGEQVTADDILFTVSMAQNPDYASPQRISWQGVETERINDLTVMFRLKNKYAQFLNILTMGILPEHLWQDAKPLNFSLNDLNVHPVGSGPYKFTKLKRNSAGDIESYTLSANKDFYDGRPYIDTLVMKFFGAETDLTAAYNNNDIQSIGFVSAQNLDKIKFKKRLNVHRLVQPRIFAVFFNQNQSVALSDKNVRLALAYATDKSEIIRTVLKDNAEAIDSPIPDNTQRLIFDVKKYEFNPALAKKILAESGWGEPDANGILSKKKERLAVKITTSTWPEFEEVASLLKKQWSAIGVEVTVDALPRLGALPQAMKDRQYQVLLFGEILGTDPDPFTFWHSSQKKEPGLNFALYDSKAADVLLEEARQTLNPSDRSAKYEDFQRLVAEDIPAIFLYSPHYLYPQSSNIRGFNTQVVSVPSNRFAEVARWYVNTKRAWKP